MTSLPKNGFNIELSGSWQLASADGEIRSVITLPGDVHTALHRAGLIPDPYFGRNEKKVQWVAEREWTVERSFTLPDAEGDWYLDIDYLDTVASVHVNGFLALEADNSFRRYRPDVSSMLKKGENTIRIVFASNVAAGAARQKQQPFYIPYSTGNSPIPDGNMLRKPQCHFGWDWNIAIAPLGLYGTIALRKLETARIEHVTTRQVHNADGSVDLHVAATLFSNTRAASMDVKSTQRGSPKCSVRQPRRWSRIETRSASPVSAPKPPASSSAARLSTNALSPIVAAFQ